ncbi:MAG: hypothetical protein PHT44_04520 [Candidatus Portnoybacteria bacterium]|nr:hypothetical protein [Candidatus Portnoybacteria bacterium]
MSEFSVRWRLGGMKDFNERMSRWHISSDDVGGIKTLCGIIIPVFAHSNLPEVNDHEGYQKSVTCKKCRKILAARAGSSSE